MARVTPSPCAWRGRKKEKLSVGAFFGAPANYFLSMESDFTPIDLSMLHTKEERKESIVFLLLACFILKYRLRDIFTSAPTNRTTVNGNRQKILGYFVEIIAIYYLSTSHREFFLHSRSTEMLFPYPSPTLR